MTSRGWFEVQEGGGTSRELYIGVCGRSITVLLVRNTRGHRRGPFSRAGPLVRSCGSTAFSPSSHHSFFAY